jgi:hypothetical protein
VCVNIEKRGERKEVDGWEICTISRRASLSCLHEHTWGRWAQKEKRGQEECGISFVSVYL